MPNWGHEREPDSPHGCSMSGQKAVRQETHETPPKHRKIPFVCESQKTEQAAQTGCGVSTL